MLCADFTDPRNVGSAFRIADAAGVGLVLAGTTPRPPNPKIAKTARTTVRSVAYLTENDPVAFLRRRKSAGTLIMALEWTNTSLPLPDYKLPPGVTSIVLIPGAERTGVEQSLLEEADVAVHLPMYGQNSSLNVAVALGIATYHLIGQLRD